MAARARLVLYIVFTTLVSYSIFLLGFFPVKSSVQQKALLRNHTLNQYTISQSTRRFNRTVIVLIDALRYDFVGEHDYMPFTRKHIAGGSGYIFTLRAHPPTVTLPRIKVNSCSQFCTDTNGTRSLNCHILSIISTEMDDGQSRINTLLSYNFALFKSSFKNAGMEIEAIVSTYRYCH